MTKVYNLLSIAHSYTVETNRALPHAIQHESGGRWSVHVAAPRAVAAGRDLRASTLAVLPGEPCPVHAINTYNRWQIHTFLYGRRLKALLAAGWDLVHCWEEPYILAGAQVARWTPPDTPLVFRTAQSLNKTYPFPFDRVEAYSLGRAAGWLCSGVTVEENLLVRPGYTGLPHTRIPLGVDVEKFRPDPAARAAVLAGLGWAADGPPVVGYLGRLVPEKGLRVLTEALDALRAPWRALIIGDGPNRREIAAWAARRPDAVRLVTSAAHADVPPYLTAMDVLACPSLTTRRWREQFGRMIVEAFAAGLPVVGSDSGEIPRVIGSTGLVVPEGNAALLSEAVGALLGDPSRRQHLAQEGRQRALNEFSWPVVARQHIDFFERLLEMRVVGPAGPASRGAAGSGHAVGHGESRGRS